MRSLYKKCKNVVVLIIVGIMILYYARARENPVI
jgi:hypothetical protein